MKRLLFIAFVAVSALVWTGVAQTKEVTSFKACGASGCRAVITSPALLLRVIRMVELQGDAVSTRTPESAPYFRLEIGVDHESGGRALTQYYVPSQGRVALQTGPDAWTWVLAGKLRPLYERMTRGVGPFATPSFTRATVGGKPARDPASYARLFALRTSTDDMPDEPDWVAIELGSARPTPWTTNAATLEYSPSKHVLWRGVEYVKLPGSLAANLEDRRSLDAPASSGGGFPWLPLLASLGGAAVLVAGALTFRRRRAQPAPAPPSLRP